MRGVRGTDVGSTFVAVNFLYFIFFVFFVRGRYGMAMGIPSMSLQAALEVCIREIPLSIIGLSYASLLDPPDNIRNEVSSHRAVRQ